MPGMVSIASPNGASDKPVSEGAKSTPTSTPVAARRTLLAASVAHAVHDGMTDLIYVLLPLWQSQFGLSLAFTGALRGLYAACMAGFQVPATRLAQRWGRPALLVGGTVLVALAYLVAGLSGALPVVCGALLLGGLGASTQHPLASALVADAYAGHRVQARRALASYNFAGDLGKTAVPALVGALLMWLSWQHSLIAVGLLGLGAAPGLAAARPAAAGRGGRWRAGPAGTAAAAGLGAAPQLGLRGSGRHRGGGQRHAHGLSDLPALCVVGQGGRGRRHRPGAGPAVCGRRPGQAAVCGAGAPPGPAAHGVAHRRRHGLVHRGHAAAALVGGAGPDAHAGPDAQWHLFGVVWLCARSGGARAA